MAQRTPPELAARFQEALALEWDPVALHYTYERPQGALGIKGTGQGCIIPLVRRVAERGGAAAFSEGTFGCLGAGYFLGFKDPHPFAWIDHFLSQGVEGVMEGEGFKRDAAIARRFIDEAGAPPAPRPFCVFKRLRDCGDESEARVVVFFVRPDQLVALITLANYARPDRYNVVAPQTSGCGGIAAEPLRQAAASDPKAVIGLLDVTVRHAVPANVLSFAVPWALLLELDEALEGSFLDKAPWQALRKRLRGAEAGG